MDPKISEVCIRSLEIFQSAKWAWMSIFLAFLVGGSTLHAPHPLLLCVLALLGLSIALFEPIQLRTMLRKHRVLLSASLVVAACLLVSALYWQSHPRPAEWLAASQGGLLLCITPFAFLLRRDRGLRTLVLVVACGVSLWHVFALPIEAVSGTRMSWSTVPLLARDVGPLHFQAAGLAEQSYFFPGLLLAVFYLAWGAVASTARFGETQGGRRALRAAALVWLVVISCIQSRSALAGASASTAVLLFSGPAALRGRIRWLVLYTGLTEVDPFSRTPYRNGRRSPKCPNQSRRTRRNFVSRSLNLRALA
ncbi:hypothetical protein, partial [Ramlibacter sp.]|uniref:hypothetical protein n=1 Tax=Ramlibacter sp. TaxID=1917967 RepID=UPI0017D19711